MVMVISKGELDAAHRQDLANAQDLRALEAAGDRGDTREGDDSQWGTLTRLLGRSCNPS